jgi:hypothetical protein
MYRALDAGKIIATIEVLKQRIDERFPKAGLAGVARDLSAAARDCARKAATLARPQWALRSLWILFIAACLAITMLLPRALKIEINNTEATNLLQTLEATINTIVLAGIGVVFLFTRERWFRRHEALKDLHQLRSLIHVIDMHQLTKDPSLVLSRESERSTAASPKRPMTAFELGRYLDYCSEMLSLTGKVAALYAQNLDDPVVIEAVNDIEMLATNLSRKIWQKIAILQAAELGHLQMRALAE